MAALKCIYKCYNLFSYQNLVFMKCQRYIMTKESIGKDSVIFNRELGIDLTMA